MSTETTLQRLQQEVHALRIQLETLKCAADLVLADAMSAAVPGHSTVQDQLLKRLREAASAARGAWTPEEWNARHREGTPVAVRPVINEAPEYKSRTRGQAWRLGHGITVVRIEGRTGGYLLSALDLMTEEEFAASPLPLATEKGRSS